MTDGQLMAYAIFFGMGFAALAVAFWFGGLRDRLARQSRRRRRRAGRARAERLATANGSPPATD